ncbi:GapR family DNA-binding domain-containing protein [Novosphingobium lindaniclasticum]
MAETTDDRLRLLIERIERLEEEKKGVGDDVKDVYAEGKAVGYPFRRDAGVVRRPGPQGQAPAHRYPRPRQPRPGAT